MHVLLTGATGFLGYRTLERLAASAAVTSVIATGRTLRPGRTVYDAKIEYVLGDLRDEGLAETLVAGADAVVHAAALSSPWGKDAAFVEANVTVQQRLLTAAKKAGCRRFVYVSTPSIYFTGSDRVGVKESDPLPKRFINAYARTKRQAEVLLERSGLEYVILRPRALIGRGDTVIVPRLLRAHETGRLRQLGDGNNAVDLTPVDNVADAILLSLTTSEGLNEAYNIANGAPVLLWPLIRDLFIKLGKAPLRGKVPTGIAMMTATLLETKSRLTNYAEPVLTRYGVGTLTQSFSLDISKARQSLGYQPRVSTAEAIDDFVNWYRYE